MVALQKPAKLDAIFFDAGNTLLFPELDVLLAPLHQRGVSPTLAQWHASEKFAKRRMDQVIVAAGEKPHGVDAEYWESYHRHFLDQLGMPNDRVLAELVALCRTSANWNQLQPGTLSALRSLRERFLLGIISNADGMIQQVLERVGLGEYFDSYTDSGLVGVEKPHHAIFDAALASLQVPPERAMYVGDIYSLDYLGATNAGMSAVLLDVSRTYAGDSHKRVESLADLLHLFQ